jgi:hypothetical protein
MPIDASPDDLDALRDLVAQLSSERDAALDECRRVMEQNDRLRHLLQQLRRAQFHAIHSSWGQTIAIDIESDSRSVVLLPNLI